MYPLVIMFKNQKEMDLLLLQIAITQWNKCYDKIEKTYICGIFDNYELEEISKSLSRPFIERFNVTFINLKKIPDEFKTTKTNRLNYALIRTWNFLKRDFILAPNDVFPIRKIDDRFFNIENEIRYKSVEAIPSSEEYWWVKNYKRTIKYFQEHYNLKQDVVYDGHIPNLITKEFMDFYLSDKNLWLDMDRNIVLTLWRVINNQKIIDKKYLATTFSMGKWDIKEEEMNDIYFVNITNPTHIESRKFLKNILKDKYGNG